MPLSETRKYVLAIGIANGGKLSIEEIEDIYGSKSKAVEVATMLRAYGFLRITDVPGRFIVRKAPADSFRMAEERKKEISEIKSGVVAYKIKQTVKAEEPDLKDPAGDAEENGVIND